MNLKEIKKDIVKYDLYHVINGVPYGNYFLTIINEGDKIIIYIEDDEGSASWAMNKDEFLNITATEELKKYINAMLYYNYIAHEGE